MPSERKSETPAHNSGITRRGMLAGALSAAAAVGLGGIKKSEAADDDPNWKVKNGRINQSICKWCFDPMSLDEICKTAVDLGCKSVELLKADSYPTLKKYGLTCAMTSSHGFVKGFNRIENHAFCIDEINKALEAAAAFGSPNVITFSGMREGLSDEEGIKNCVEGLKKVMGLAEKNKVNICFEVLNSRVDFKMKGHPDYQGDKLEWAVEVCQKVGSPRMKILFDIYHIQIMEGDIITRIKQYKEYIGHYHTAGNPGRNELDETQEINYPPIMKAILETGYTGFVGQEFIPRNADKVASLRQAVKLCDV
jgi:hydroxypyruvate isomerase